MALKTVGPADVVPSLEKSEDRRYHTISLAWLLVAWGCHLKGKDMDLLNQPPSGSRLAFQKSTGCGPPKLNDLRAP